MSGRFTVTKRIFCQKKKRRGKEGRRVKGDRENQNGREHIPSPRRHQSSFGPKVLQGAEPWWIESKCLWNRRESSGSGFGRNRTADGVVPGLELDGDDVVCGLGTWVVGWN